MEAREPDRWLTSTPAVTSTPTQPTDSDLMEEVGEGDDRDNTGSRQQQSVSHDDV